MKNPYTLSKDYPALYELVSSGQLAVCFVDHSFRPDDPEPSRDVCQVRKWDDYDIDFTARGTHYGGVKTFHRSRGSERELFISQCKRMNVEWIKNN